MCASLLECAPDTLATLYSGNWVDQKLDGHDWLRPLSHIVIPPAVRWWCRCNTSDRVLRHHTPTLAVLASLTQRMGIRTDSASSWKTWATAAGDRTMKSCGPLSSYSSDLLGCTSVAKAGELHAAYQSLTQGVPGR